MADLTITYGGFDYGFFFTDQRIDVDATLTTIQVIDLYEVIKLAQETEVGISFDTIANGEGRTPLQGSDSTYLTVILFDNWRLNSLKTSGYIVVTGGNLVREDQGLPVQPNPLVTAYIQTSQAGVLVETGTSGLTPVESQALLNIYQEMLTKERYKSLQFNRENTVEDQRITSYVAGDESEEEVEIAVTYDNDNIPIKEEIQSS
jgi:hypothetical protein